MKQYKESYNDINKDFIKIKYIYVNDNKLHLSKGKTEFIYNAHISEDFIAQNEEYININYISEISIPEEHSYSIYINSNLGYTTRSYKTFRISFGDKTFLMFENQFKKFKNIINNE